MLNRRNFSHIVLNVTGMVLPMLVGVAVVPGLIQRLGQDRFGALALAWALVGYFGLLDLGLGRALTQYLSREQAAGMALDKQAAMARTARRLMVWIGMGWATLLLLATPLIGTTISMPADVRAEAPAAWAMLAIAVPLLMWSTCSTGVLEARSRFVSINSVRVPAGAATFCVPWLIALITNDLRAIMAGLLLVRLVTAFAFAWLARSEFRTDITGPVGGLRSLLRFGGWLTISNVVGPFLSYFDRFAIAALLSMAAVTHYTVSFDVLTRLPALSVAMMGVLFPLLAHTHGLEKQESASTARLIDSATRLLVAFWLPALAMVSLLGPLFLNMWVGPELAQLSTSVWHWLAVGVVVNGFAHLPHTLLQSAGRTDSIAKIHLSELLPYCLALWWALMHWGVVGAAMVWTARVIIDTGLLFFCGMRQFPTSGRVLRRGLAWAAASGCLLALIGWSHQANAESPAGQANGIFLVVSTTCAAFWCGYHLYYLRQTK